MPAQITCKELYCLFHQGVEYQDDNQGTGAIHHVPLPRCLLWVMNHESSFYLLSVSIIFSSIAISLLIFVSRLWIQLLVSVPVLGTRLSFSIKFLSITISLLLPFSVLWAHLAVSVPVQGLGGKAFWRCGEGGAGDYEQGNKKTNLKTFTRFLTCGFGSLTRVVSSTSSMRETGDFFLHIY